MQESDLTKILYPKSLFKNIKIIIGNSQNFLKKSKEEQSFVSKKLQTLCTLLDISNGLKNQNFYRNLFLYEKQIFTSEYKNLCSKLIRRHDSLEFKNQLIIFISIVIDYVCQKKYIRNSIKANDILNCLNPEKIFHLILTKFLDSSIQKPDQDPSYDGCNFNRKVLKSIFRVAIVTNLIIYISEIIFQGDPQKSDLVIKIHQDISNIIHNNSLKSRSQALNKTSEQLITLFSIAFGIKSKSYGYFDKYGAFKSVKVLFIPPILFKYIISPAYIPIITPPETEYNNGKDILMYYKSIKNGISKVEFSTESKNALILSNQKSFIVNENALELFKFLDKLTYNEIKDLKCKPFIPLALFKSIRNEIITLKRKLTITKYKAISACYFAYPLSQNKGDANVKIIHELDQPENELKISRRLCFLKNDYKEVQMLRTYHNTILMMAEMFKGFPLYFINSCDFRLRMYPYNFLFGRTSGIYKHLLNEPSSTISDEGLRVMLESYYKKSESKLCEFKSYCKKEEIIKKFNEIEKEEPKVTSKSSFYRALLWKELQNLTVNNFKTGFMIGIDQNSSAPVILSLVLGDKALAEKTNIISGLETKDVNTFIMNRSKKKFKNIVSEISLHTIATNRKLQKRLFMRFLCNETQWGRFKEIRKYISNEADAKILAKIYPNFIRDVFSTVCKKRDKLNQVIKFYLESSGNKPIQIKTLDGSLIKWVNFKKSRANTKLKVKHPTIEKRYSFHYQNYDNKAIDKIKMLSGFIPNLIHSVDGAIMRLIITHIYHNDSKQNYVINHLHDSIMYHPNYHETVMNSIKRVYTSNKLCGILKNTLFDQLRENLVDVDKIKFDLLIDDFFIDYEELIIDEKSFNTKKVFPFS